MEKAGRNKKEGKDDKQKDRKIEDQVLKCLDEAATPDAKVQLLLRKCVESERVAKTLRQEKKLQEKMLEAVQREKENLQREYNRSILIRDKLQEVCREQQKLIKSVRDESMQKIREEEERRKENQTKFQASLNDITQSLAKNNEENLKLRDHNIEMTKKLKYLSEQYQTREQQLEELNVQVDLQCRANAAKVEKVQIESAMEKEILIKEKEIALEKVLICKKQLKDLTDREAELKQQLNLYTSKYDDFQSTLQKSTDIFENYKSDIEKLSKQTRLLEKEAFEWKRKWEKSNAKLIKMSTEKLERDEMALRSQKQVDQLQKLLRCLQSERTHLYQVLSDNNIECPKQEPAKPAATKPTEPPSTISNGIKSKGRKKADVKNVEKATPAPVETPASVETPSPVESPAPVETPATVESPAPVVIPAPVESPAPVEIPAATQVPTKAAIEPPAVEKVAVGESPAVATEASTAEAELKQESPAASPAPRGNGISEPAAVSVSN